MTEINGHVPCLEEDHIECKLRSDAKFKEEVLIERTVETTVKKPYDTGLFDQNSIVDGTKDYLFSGRRKGSLSES